MHYSIIEPSTEYRTAFMDMARDFIADGEVRFNQAIDDFDAYIESLNQHLDGKKLPDKFIPYYTYWMLRGDGLIVAESRLRLELTQTLHKEGGHISYAVRPSERQKGCGAKLLALTLEKARNHGLARVLVTCDKDNVASAKIIANNGGVLENQVISDWTAKIVSRYWIEL